MSRDDFEFARQALEAADSVAAKPSQSDTRSHRVGSGRVSVRGVPDQSPEPVDLSRLGHRSAVTLAAQSNGIGPCVLVGWPYGKLPIKGWQDGHIWQSGRWTWTPEDQPLAPYLYPSPAAVNLMFPLPVGLSGTGWEPQEGSRSLSLAIVADPGEVPSEIAGTRALVAAVIACDLTTGDLRDAADIGDYGVATVRRFRAEAEALDAHAAACRAVISRTLDWVAELSTPDPSPAFVTVPAQIRGHVTLSPI